MAFIRFHAISDLHIVLHTELVGLIIWILISAELSETELQNNDLLPTEIIPVFISILGSNKEGRKESQGLNPASGWHYPQATKADRKPLIPHPEEQDNYPFISSIIHLFAHSSWTQLPLLLGCKLCTVPQCSSAPELSVLPQEQPFLSTTAPAAHCPPDVL